jgi:hypothetical protein
MSDVVNLNRFRKKRRMQAEDERAARNRAKFGRTKAEKTKDAAEKEQARRRLDGHLTDDGS